MTEKVAQDVLKRFDGLKSERNTLENTWRECGDYSFPLRAQGFEGTNPDASTSQNKRAHLYDSTSTDAARILASGVQTGITPANSRWFGMRVWDESDAERTWMDESSDMLWEAIHTSNFDAEALEGLLDAVTFGWFVMLITLDEAQDGTINGFRFELLPVAQCYCAASKPGGEIDTLFRPYVLTVEQCVSEFGLDEVSEKTRDAYLEQKYDEKVNLLQAIYPRRHGKQDARRARNMPFASVHVESDGKKVVRESGYHEKPFVAPRWSKIPNSVYAVGPMFDALPDVKTLNELAKMELANVDMAVAGMWIAEDDGVLNPRTVKVGARKIIVANSVDSMRELKSGANFNISFTKRAELAAQIRKIMMADQLPPVEGQPRTATEFYARINLIRQLLGPVYGRMQSEYLKPLIQRCFGLAFRAGLFQDPPESLAGRQYSITYLSPMAKSQKLEEVAAIDGAVARTAAVVQATQDPSAWDNLDIDEGLRESYDGLGVPASLVRSADDVEEIRRARTEAQQAAQQQAVQTELGMEAASAGIQRMATSE